jgi:hypothetical protein
MQVVLIITALIRVQIQISGSSNAVKVIKVIIIIVIIVGISSKSS